MKKKTDTLKQLLTIIAFAVMLAGIVPSAAAEEGETAATADKLPALARGECELRLVTTMLRGLSQTAAQISDNNIDAVFEVAVQLCGKLRVYDYAFSDLNERLNLGDRARPATQNAGE